MKILVTVVTILFFASNLFGQADSADIFYQIRTDKDVYYPNDQIHWKAVLKNLSSDTLHFSALSGSSFFYWALIDSTGEHWDESAYLDSIITYSLPPGDSLIENWTTEIKRATGHLPFNLYYGLMKPWYKWDSLKTDTTSFIITEATNITKPAVHKVENFDIARLYPNPFNARITIDFTILSPGLYDLSIYDLSGRKLVTLVNTGLNRGNYSFSWDATDMSSGVYLVRLSDGPQTITRKALLVK